MKENKKGRKPIIVVVVSALVILISILGYTYSYFSAQVNENNKTKTVIKVNNGLSLIFTGTAEVEAQKLVPGDKRTKTFTVENKLDTNVKYNIYIENVENGFNEDLVYTLKKGDDIVVSETPLPKTKTGKSYIKTSIEIAGKTTDNYTLEIEYKYLADKSQDDYQGATFKGTVGIDTEQVKGSFADYLMDLVDNDGDSNTSRLIQFTQPNTEQTQDKATIDYRYVGADPDNYVCLEADGECSDDELYRIIGIIPTQKTVGGEFEYRVKLIKATNYVGSSAEEDTKGYTPEGYGYRWCGSSTNKINDWTASTLNTDVLNGIDTKDSYWDSISDYHNYIDNTVWYLGGSGAGSSTSYYVDERGINRGNAAGKDNINTVTKIGLMYPSDYTYATSGNDAKNNWLWKKGSYQWTLTSDPWANNIVYYMNGNNYITNFNVTDIIGVRPVFTLASNVKIYDGTGDHDHPYLISL